jgi:hypothetical protein
LSCSIAHTYIFLFSSDLNKFHFENRMNSDTDELQPLNIKGNNLPDLCRVNSEDRPLLPSSSPNMDLSDHHHSPPWNTDIIDDLEYAEIINQAERAIEGEILPVRIAAGSSGSYFVRNLEGVCLN